MSVGRQDYEDTCPECGELIDFKGRSADVTMVEMGRDINLAAACDSCGTRLNIWARIMSAEPL